METEQTKTTTDTKQLQGHKTAEEEKELHRNKTTRVRKNNCK